MARAPGPKTEGPTKAKPSVKKGRNLVILFDGTGNELGRNISNVLKLFRIGERNAQQVCYYSPGVGTISLENPWSRFTQKLNGIVGLATGKGLDGNVLGAYRFLVENWQEGDRIFLFGFSRGAWTARVLAGLLHLIGLLRPEQLNMSESAMGTYKKAAMENDLPLAWNFSKVIGARHPIVDFVGVWDTVASVLVPRPDRLWLPSLETLPFTKTNPSVAIFRHALSLDEQRRMFRVADWVEPQDHKPNPFSAATKPQDIKQVWFAGVHGDIGGGYPEPESGLSKIPLIWLIDQAKVAGLRVSPRMYNFLAKGEPRAGSKYVYVEPSATGTLHRSLKGLWWILECLPKRVKYMEGKRRSFLGFYLPLAEPRFVPPGAVIHPTVRERMNEMPKYQPKNLPKE